MVKFCFEEQDSEEIEELSSSILRIIRGSEIEVAKYHAMLAKSPPFHTKHHKKNKYLE